MSLISTRKGHFYGIYSNVFRLQVCPRSMSTLFYYSFASAVVDVHSSHMSSSASWSRFSPPSNFVNGHVSTMWFMVCCRPQSQEGAWARPHLCKLARHGPGPVWKRFIRDHVRRRRSKPGCRIVGSVTIVWLATEADDQTIFNVIRIGAARGDAAARCRYRAHVPVHVHPYSSTRMQTVRG